MAYASSHSRGDGVGRRCRRRRTAPITAAASSAYVAPGAASVGSAGHALGHVQAAVGGQAGQQHVGEAELGRGCRGCETYAHAQAPITRSRPPTLRDDVELAQLAHRGLHGRLLGLVGDEHQPGVGADALLLGGADADVVAGEHAGDRVQHAGPVGDVEAEQVLGATSRRSAGSSPGRTCRASRGCPATG